MRGRQTLRRWIRRGGAALIALGLVVIYFGFYEVVGTGAMTAHAQRILRAEFASPPPVVATPEATTPPAPRPGDAIGRLEIPGIGLDVMVVEGIEPGDLSKGPGHYPGTASFGSTGASAIAGHSSGWGAPFMHLGRLRRGDRIMLRTKDSSFTYTVTSTLVVQPTAVWVLGGDPHSTAARKLVLTTCWPVFTHRQRLIIFADLTSA